MIVAIDFDGTIVEHKFPKIGLPLDGAIEALRLIADTHTLIIWTCRDGDKRDAVREWLRTWGISALINENAPGIEGFAAQKVYADVYIDDRNLGGFPGWDVAMALLRQHPKWDKSLLTAKGD